MTESACAKRLLWQSPKSRPQILIFLSAAPLTRRVLSDEMSMLSTGSLWPYSDRKNLRVSVKKTLMVKSSSDTANSLPATVPCKEIQSCVYSALIKPADLYGMYAEHLSSQKIEMVCMVSTVQNNTNNDARQTYM